MYGRLDYGFADDPKIRRISAFAECFFFRAVALSGRNKWGGFIPNESLNDISPAPKRGKKSPESLLEELLNADLCTREPTGIRISSFRQWNPYGIPSSERKDISTPRVKKHREKIESDNETRFDSDAGNAETPIEERKGKERKGKDISPSPSAPVPVEAEVVLPSTKRAARHTALSETTETHRLRLAFEDAYRQHYGCEHLWDGRCGKEAKWMTDAAGLDECVRRMKIGFDDAPKWIANGGTFDFHAFKACFNRLGIGATSLMAGAVTPGSPDAIDEFNRIFKGGNP